MSALRTLILSLLLAAAAPTAAFADNGVSKDSCSPSTIGDWYCECDTPTDPIYEVADTSADCEEACGTYPESDSWTLYECLAVDGEAVADRYDQGNVTIEANDYVTGTSDVDTGESEELVEERRNPIIPDLNVDIPGLDFETFSNVRTVDGYTESSFIGTYINAVYGYLIAAGSVIAVVLLMIGGLQYALARGKSKYIEAAKARITNAITGIVLLLVAYNIAFLINPQLVTFSALRVKTVPRIPTENIVEPTEGVDAAPTGNYYGQSDWQDCMLAQFGASSSEVESRLETVTYNGGSYKVHELIKDDLQAVFDEIEAANIDYNITSIGTQYWRANRNNANALSFHAWGVALDINPDTNPNCPKSDPDYPCEYDIPPEIVSIFKAHNFGWGGNWKSLKDYMHFSTNRFCGGSR